MGGDLAVWTVCFVAFVLVQTSCADGTTAAGEITADEEGFLGYGIEGMVEGGSAGCTGVDHSNDESGRMGVKDRKGRDV